ncbi:MAG: flagellar biosynthetic protein FliO [Rhodospirillales bacterium]|nr:flagellar biosynthetic protein FliO [Rhodospirillales bacterium]
MTGWSRIKSIGVAWICLCALLLQSSAGADQVTANRPVEASPAADSAPGIGSTSAPAPEQRVGNILKKHAEAVADSEESEPARDAKPLDQPVEDAEVAGDPEATAEDGSVASPLLEGKSKSSADDLAEEQDGSFSSVTLADLMNGGGPGGSTDGSNASGGAFGSSTLLNTLAALGLVIGLVLLLRWVAGRFGGRAAGGSSPVVEVMSRTMIAPKNHVLILRIGGRLLVVNDSSSGMRTLAEIDEPEEVAELLGSISATRDSSLTNSFNRMLHKFNGDYEATEDANEEGVDEAEHQVDRARDSVHALLSRLRQIGQPGVSK